MDGDEGFGDGALGLAVDAEFGGEDAAGVGVGWGGGGEG